MQIPSNGIIDASPTALRNASYFHVPSDLHEGALHSFNVAFQRELPARFVLDVAYVGNRGHDVQTQFNENAAHRDRPGERTVGRCSCRSARRRTSRPGFRTKTDYNSLQMKLDRRFSGGVLVTTSYTLGRGWSYVNGDSNTTISTPADIERSWARTDQDRLHSFVDELRVPDAGRARTEMAAGRPAEPGARGLAVQWHLLGRSPDRRSTSR